MAGEPQERIGVEIVVTDSGTPVVKRHTEETKRALGEVERASRRSGAEVSGGMRTAGVATEGLGRTMQKSQVAAMALSGGLSQVGGRASMAASAISQLVVTGLNPLGIALAAASIGIGVLVSRHAEGAAAAEKHAEGVRSLVAELKNASVGIAGIATGDPTAARRAFLQQQILERTQFQERFRETTALFGQQRAAGGPTTLSLGEFNQMLDLAKKKGDELNTLKADLAKLEGEAAAHAAARLRADERDLQIARERMELGTELIRARTLEATIRRTFEDARAFRNRSPEFVPGALPTVGGDRVGGFDETALSDDPSVMPFSTDNERFREAFDRLDQEIRNRDIAPWKAAGNRAGDAMAQGISDSLSTAVLSGEFDLADLGRTMGETLVRTFMDALVQAAIGDQLRTALQGLFASVGGVFAGGGGGPPADNTVTFAPTGASGVSARGPGVTIAVEPAPVIVASERVLASVSDETLRGRVLTSMQSAGNPGRRA